MNQQTDFTQWVQRLPWHSEVKLDPRWAVNDVARTYARHGWRVAWVEMCLYMRDAMRNPDHWASWPSNQSSNGGV